MDEYGELIMPSRSVYSDILALIAEHAIAVEGVNRDILQNLIHKELVLVDNTVAGSLILIKSELKQIKKDNNINDSNLSVIK